MELVSVERRGALVRGARDVAKLELRDHYAVDRELFAAWARGETAVVEKALTQSLGRVVARIAAGQRLRRVKVVSEPLSDYSRFAFEASRRLVTAGEEIRWLPRRTASTLLLPLNDFFVLDATAVVFEVLGGANERTEQQLYRDPVAVKRCAEAFAAAWELATPHRDYRP